MDSGNMEIIVTLGFAAYLFLAFGIGCLVGHFVAYRIRG